MSAGVRIKNHPLVDCIVGTGIFIGRGQAVIDFTGLFVTGNTFDLTINGVAIVQVPFATNHNTTMRNIATSINNHAAVSGFAIKAQTIGRILIESSTSGVDVTLSGLAIAGGATRPSAQIQPGSSGSYQEQPAIYVYAAPGSGGEATEATLLNVLANVTSKIQRIQGSANYNKAITYAAVVGAPGGVNPTVIVHTGTTVVGAETITETITYANPLIDNSRVSNIAYT